MEKKKKQFQNFFYFQIKQICNLCTSLGQKNAHYQRCVSLIQAKITQENTSYIV